MPGLTLAIQNLSFFWLIGFHLIPTLTECQLTCNNYVHCKNGGVCSTPPNSYTQMLLHFHTGGLHKYSVLNIGTPDQKSLCHEYKYVT